MQVWIIEYRVRAGWRPMTGNSPTKHEATFRLKVRQKLEPEEEFRIVKYVREDRGG